MHHFGRDFKQPRFRPRCSICFDVLVSVNGQVLHRQDVEHPGHHIGRYREVGDHRPELLRRDPA